MGYTHHWQHTRDFTEEEWEQIGEGFRQLIDALPDVPLGDMEGEGEPILLADYIAFNGRAPRCCEPFVLCRTRRAWQAWRMLPRDRPWGDFCKTQSLPYDLAVMCILLLICEIAPGALEVESDGELEG